MSEGQKKQEAVGVEIRDLVKTFPAYDQKNKEIYAANHVTLSVKPGEMVTLLGPSGCGKTSLLRMVAGFLMPSSGEIYIGNREVSKIPPNKRNVGMMFQSYALFPHLSVYDNVAYGLKLKHMGKQEIHDRVRSILQLMQIEDYASRFPNEISGGQQQRVALARAVVTEPSVLLFDEPLSNLDAKLRVQMRTTIKKLQRDLGITTVYVTHDQEEALAISDRIAVMKEGNIMQVGAPEEIYRKPANPFVANFIGVSNFIDCEVAASGGKGTVKIEGKYSFEMPVNQSYSGEAILSARPEQLFLRESGIPGIITLALFLGDFVQYEIRLENGQIIELNEYTKDTDSTRSVGEKVCVAFNPKQVSLYKKGSEEVLSC